jgi:hypothetical protein
MDRPRSFLWMRHGLASPYRVRLPSGSTALAPLKRRASVIEA